MVKALMYALVVHLQIEIVKITFSFPRLASAHLITSLDKAGQVGLGPDLVDHGVALLRSGHVARRHRYVGEVAAAVPGEFLEHKGRHDGGHDAHEEVLHAGQAELLGHPKQPLHILGIARISRELCLRPVLADPPAQGLQGDHPHPVG